ncbi:bifunctional glutamate N-acetyltransferase/amino-acid acetyltransferase ArgJ [Alkalibacterium sp. 20]|uniref:bifunctional glutamate N-acetyltransferase/amino-acid acetyltransferase ArgJ n=1 Tax=Alkalibacterium sp. 20 TaxID=1798803 RepID=UPI00090049E5|nr:bifunctional glutamate N-acetyltransferase/amino-acid acetyltransferase ArgJ [Alkalibacterium sp. 20]OJF92196.1 arginine biosynthesis protein ArgJ [Alkalibacterium sp. 20]
METIQKTKSEQLLKKVSGNVCAATGFAASGIHAGFKRKRKDLALIYSYTKSTTASVYTQNKVIGAPLVITKQHSQNGHAQAIICNSGNANTCNANGLEIASDVCSILSAKLGIAQEDILVASTGVIGQPLSLDPFKMGIPALVEQLENTGGSHAAKAILTTDKEIKESAVEFQLGETTARLGGISKGSGMIHPNMATMLGFITTDVAITPTALKQALKEVTTDTFNMISVDGDTSTNDMVTVLANGQLGNNEIVSDQDPDYTVFKQALHAVCEELAIAIAKDGEGASTLITCNVSKAKTEQQAKLVAKQVISSNLVKAAVYGRDANVGRLLCAVGYSGAEVDFQLVDISLRSRELGTVCVCEAGAIVPFDEDKAYAILGTDELFIDVSFNEGVKQATAWGCDLTYDYVKINSAYRS